MTAMRTETGIEIVSREEFAQFYFDNKPGEHAVFGGPTTRGKTTMAFDLLEYCATPECPAYIAVSKPHDPVTARESERLGYRRVTEWPVPPRVKDIFGDKKPSGYVIWPKFGDIDRDMDRCAYVTARLLGDRYTAGVRNKHGILVMDDTMIKSKIMGLDRQMTTILAMAGGMGISQWTFVQKPTDSGRTAIWAYSQSEHIFLTRDTDRRNRDRYNEIGGFDGQFVARTVNSLHPYQFLYLKRTEGYVCIVDKK
jgi:hypothetical protein